MSSDSSSSLPPPRARPSTTPMVAFGMVRKRSTMLVEGAQRRSASAAAAVGSVWISVTSACAMKKSGLALRKTTTRTAVVGLELATEAVELADHRQVEQIDRRMVDGDDARRPRSPRDTAASDSHRTPSSSSCRVGCSMHAGIGCGGGALPDHAPRRRDCAVGSPWRRSPVWHATCGPRLTRAALERKHYATRRTSMEQPIVSSPGPIARRRDGARAWRRAAQPHRRSGAHRSGLRDRRGRSPATSFEHAFQRFAATAEAGGCSPSGRRCSRRCPTAPRCGHAGGQLRPHLRRVHGRRRSSTPAGLVEADGDGGARRFPRPTPVDPDPRVLRRSAARHARSLARADRLRSRRGRRGGQPGLHARPGVEPRHRLHRLRRRRARSEGARLRLAALPATAPGGAVAAPRCSPRRPTRSCCRCRSKKCAAGCDIEPARQTHPNGILVANRGEEPQFV